MESRSLTDQIREDPSSPELRAAHARFLFHQARYREALEEIQATFELQSRHPTATLLREMNDLRTRVVRDHLPEVAGSVAPLVQAGTAPIIENGEVVEIALTISPSNIDRFAQGLSSRELQRVEALSLVVDAVSNRVLTMLANVGAPKLVEFRGWLRGRVGESSLRALAASAIGQRLEVVYLRASRLNNELVRAMATCSEHLEELTFRSDAPEVFSDDGAIAIADAPNLRRLRRLRLTGTTIGQRGVLALATSPSLRALRDLDLSDGSITNEGARILAAATLPRLKTLDVRRNRIDDAGIVALVQAGFEVQADGQHAR